MRSIFQTAARVSALPACLAGAKNLARIAFPGLRRVVAPQDVLIPSPEEQCKLMKDDEFLDGGMVRAADIRAAAKKRQARIGELKQHFGNKYATAKVRKVGPNVFIGPVQMAENAQLLKKGNFKVVLTDHTHRSGTFFKNGVTKLIFQTRNSSRAELESLIWRGSFMGRADNPFKVSASGNFLAAVESEDITEVVEEVAALMHSC